MQKFVSALAVLALVGGVSLTGCKEASQENMKGLVTALDQPGNAITIDGTAYTVSEGVVWPVDLATNDSVEFAAAGTVISALDKIRIPGNPVGDMVDSTGAALDSAGAAMGAAADSAGAALDSAVTTPGEAAAGQK